MALRHLIAELKALTEEGRMGAGHMGGHGGGHHHGRGIGVVGVGPWWYPGCPPGYEVMADGSCKKVKKEHGSGVAVGDFPKCPPGKKMTVGGTCE